MKITIERTLADRFKLYAAVTGMSVQDAVKHALNEWMTICGEADIEVLTGCQMPMPGDSLRSENRPALGLLN